MQNIIRFGSLHRRQSTIPTNKYLDFPDFDPGFITRSRGTSAAVAAFKDALHRFAPTRRSCQSLPCSGNWKIRWVASDCCGDVAIFWRVALLLTSIGLYGLETSV